MSYTVQRTEREHIPQPRRVRMFYSGKPERGLAKWDEDPNKAAPLTIEAAREIASTFGGRVTPMQEPVTTVVRNHDGSYTVSAVINGVREHQQYQGYPLKEARAKFIANYF